MQLIMNDITHQNTTKLKGMKRNYLTTILTSFLFAISLITTAQEIQECGTKIGQAQIDMERERLQNKSGVTSVQSIPCIDKKISVTVHLIALEDSSNIADIALIDDALARLNEAFAPICLTFERCSTNYVYANKYDTLDQSVDLGTVLLNHYEPNTLNLYVPNLLTIGNGLLGVNGWAPLPPSSKDYIFVRKNALQGNTLIHETGHYFGLYHPFDVDFGIEYVDGSNCETAGDLICDTDADVAIGVNDSDCEYISEFVDPHGDYYHPKTDNYMSYYSGCRCTFTHQQYIRMAEMYYTYRSHLW